ncbi:MAG TPA: hypothetical protein VGV35_04370 [Bryobacteraceae bacterium]|nr:hypothetical protein [Bryobacteraceae bacterium]
MARRTWVFSPHRGGQKVSPALQEQTRQRVLKHATKIIPKKASQLSVWFRGPFCYIDAQEPDSPEPMKLCRLRYMGSLSGWSMAFYTYSNEKYESCTFPSGTFCGSPEEALEIGVIYLR